jgi:hypothetical protein
LLQSFRTDSSLSESFVDSLRTQWAVRNGNDALVTAKLKRELTATQTRNEKLLWRYVDGNPNIQQDFAKLKKMLDHEVECLESRISESEMVRATFDELVDFTRKMPSELDRILGRRTTRSATKNGLKYDPENGILIKITLLLSINYVLFLLGM